MGADEIDAGKGYISIDSPVARQAAGKGLDDEIEVEIAGNRRCYIITDIRYD